VAQTLSHVLATYDETTQAHSERVAASAARLAERTGLLPEDVDDVRMAGLLHDIGRLGIRMTSQQPTTAALATEHGLDRLHPAMGARILAGVDALADLAPLVLCHHECVDGSGYPDGLRREEIPLGARVLAIADTWDHLTQPGGEILPLQQAVARLRADAGTCLDPALVDTWVRVVSSAA